MGLEQEYRHHPGVRQAQGNIGLGQRSGASLGQNRKEIRCAIQSGVRRDPRTDGAFIEAQEQDRLPFAGRVVSRKTQAICSHAWRND